MSRYETAAPDGQPTHVPAVRIRGVETGSDRYNALLSQYQGALAQFQLGQQQQVAISGQRYYKSSRSVPGAHMTYQNNEGQETITLELTTAGGEEEHKVESEEYWKWAIVELRVPNIQGLTSWVASAFMNPPPNNGKLGAAKNKIAPLDPVNPPLSYPIDELGTFIADVQDNDGYASLRVDLRPYPGGVKFDLYGYTKKYTTTGPGPNTTSAKRAGRKSANISTGGATWHSTSGLNSGPWYSTSSISGRAIGNIDWSNSTTIANIEIDFPALTGSTFNASISQSSLNFLYAANGAFSSQGPSYAGTSFTWTPGSGNMPDPTTLNVSGLISAAGGLFTETTTFGADGIVKEVRGLGAMDFNGSGALNGAGPTDADGQWGITFFDYHLYWVGDHPTVTTNVFPDRDCPVSFVMLDDSPDGMTNHFGSPLKDNSYRWESTKKYPDRWNMKVMPSMAHMPGLDEALLPSPTFANHYSMTKLGTVIINPRKGKGGIKFIAA